MKTIVFLVCGILLGVSAQATAPAPAEGAIDLVDLSGDTARQSVVAAGTPILYNGHRPPAGRLLPGALRCVDRPLRRFGILAIILSKIERVKPMGHLPDGRRQKCYYLVQKDSKYDVRKDFSVFVK